MLHGYCPGSSFRRSRTKVNRQTRPRTVVTPPKWSSAPIGGVHRQGLLYTRDRQIKAVDKTATLPSPEIYTNRLKSHRLLLLQERLRLLGAQIDHHGAAQFLLPLEAVFALQLRKAAAVSPVRQEGVLSIDRWIHHRRRQQTDRPTDRQRHAEDFR